MYKIFLIIFLSFTALPAVVNAQNPPPVDQVFKVTTEIPDKNTVTVKWEVAPGYYLYRDRFKFEALKPSLVEIDQPILPSGIHKEDNLFGKYEVYQGQVAINLLFHRTNDQNFLFKVSYQGCSESGYCYPPESRYYQINFAKNSIEPYLMPEPVAAAAPMTELGKISKILHTESLFFIALWFLGGGLLLSFTPCVLPMIPILSGIIAGHDKKTLTTGKAFRLSLVYVLSMSLTYAVAGALIGYLGGSVQAALQKPWVIITFSAVFVALALSLFGLYDLTLPKRFEQYLAKKSKKIKGGHYLSVFLMGCLATLIVSPCITPPLFGALAYIGQTGDALVGGVSLFAMGIGMGIPLLLIGTAAGGVLPKAGSWMETIKSFLGVMLLMVAIYMMERVLPAPIALALWGSLLIICAVYMGALSPTPEHGLGKLWKGTGFVIIIYGILLLIGAALGNHDPLNPLQRWTGSAVSTTQAPEMEIPVVRIKSLAEFTQALKKANAQGKPVILDFYADWCITCKQMEYRTFADPKVKPLLTDQFVFIQADVTENDATDKMLMQHFGVVAPPSILFFGKDGQELHDLRIVGDMGPKDFLEVLDSVIR